MFFTSVKYFFGWCHPKLFKLICKNINKVMKIVYKLWKMGGCLFEFKLPPPNS